MSRRVDREVRDAVATILTIHQRHKGGCLCGWHVLGHSHAQHQADAIAGAGLLLHITKDER